MGNEIYDRMASVMAKIDAIGKDKKNITQGFSFRGIDDVYNAIHPLLAEEKIFMTTEVLSERSEERQTKSGGNLIYRILHIKYNFFTVDGSSVSAIVIGEGMDSGDKAANKAMAIGHKYALLQAFAIPTMDMVDPDRESHETKPKAKVPDGLDDQKDSTGNFSPRLTGGDLTPLAYGDKGKMRELWKAFNGLMALKDPQGVDVFPSSDKKDAQAAAHPGNQNLDYIARDYLHLQKLYEKWERRGEEIMASRKTSTSDTEKLDEEFTLALGKGE
jgi:hypothetical protein